MKKIYLCLIFIFFQASLAHSEEQGMVDYVEAKDFSKPYSERRGDYGGLFEIKLESLIPDTYVSPVDSEDYSSLWSKNSLQILLIGFSQKINFNFGALTFDAGYGAGEVSSDESGVSRTLRLNYPYIGAGLYLDQIANDPEFVPYGKIKIRQETIEESTKTSSYSKDLGVGMGYSLGLLYNIGRLDKGSSSNAYVNYGIENTYLDIFVAQYFKSDNKEQILIQNTDLTYGAGLVWEF